MKNIWIFLKMGLSADYGKNYKSDEQKKTRNSESATSYPLYNLFFL